MGGRNIITIPCCYVRSYCGSFGAGWDLGTQGGIAQHLPQFSNKEMDEINQQIQQAQVYAGNCALPFCSIWEKEDKR